MSDDVPAVDITALGREYGAAGRIEFHDTPLGPVVKLRAAGASAVVALQGAQLLNWTPPAASEAIWLSPLCRPAAGKSLRGGTPICWPWFGPPPEAHGGPAHGFVRGALWTPAYSKVADDESIVAFRFRTQRQHHAIWPHAAEVTLVVRLGKTLDLDLLTTNTGDAPFALTAALHTYFAVGDIASTEISGFDGCTYIDKLDADARRVQAGPVGFAGEVDRIYLDAPGPVLIHDRANARIIRIDSRGSRSTVVWNPWVEKSARLGDMTADGYRSMVCVETANAGDDCIGLEPGGTHVLEATYSLVA